MKILLLNEIYVRCIYAHVKEVIRDSLRKGFQEKTIRKIIRKLLENY